MAISNPSSSAGNTIKITDTNGVCIRTIPPGDTYTLPSDDDVSIGGVSGSGYEVGETFLI